MPVMFLLVATAYAQVCDETTLVDQAHQALASFNALDLEGYARSRDAALGLISCQPQPVGPGTALDVHVLMALDAYVARQPAVAVASLRSALVIDPAFTLPLEQPPAPLLDLLDEARLLGAGPEQTPTVPPGTALLVDGRAALALPVARPAVVQGVRDGEVLFTLLREPGVPLPWPGMDRPTLVIEPLPPAPSERAQPLLLGAGVNAALAVGLWTAAMANYREFEELEASIVSGEQALDSSTRMQLEQHARVANRLGYAAQATTGAAVVLGVTGVVVRF